MVVKELKTTELKMYENNPRKNEGAVDAVAASIKNFGFKVPIIVDKDNVIVAGHTRLLAAKKLGLDKVPVIIADDLTDEQIRAFRLADNKVGELAEWDFNKLEAEIFNLDDFDLTQFGFDMKEINPDAFGEDFSLPDDDKPQTRTITLSLCEEQYQICESVIDYFNDKIEHDFGNNNKRSNALFEAVYSWAKQNSLL